MPAIGAEFKGKAKAPSFYKPAAAPASQPKESHWPILVGGALAGAAILLLLRNRSSGTTGTGPVLSVYPSGMADTSQIMNMQGTIQALLNNPNTGQTVGGAPPTDSQAGVTSQDVSSGGYQQNPGPLSGADIVTNNAYWNSINQKLNEMKGNAPVSPLFPLSSQVPNSASPETQATASQYQNLVLGAFDTPGSTTYGQPVDVSQGLTAQDIQAQIAYLQGVQKSGAYNPNLPAISSQQAVSGLIASEQAALASGAFK